MEVSKLEGQIIVRDLNLFLGKATQGINRVYQLHRQQGGVFIDTSFQDEESPSLLYKTRISIAPPRLVHSEIKWDKHDFPYELETYEVDGEEVVVPLYRQFGNSLGEFLEEVVIEMLRSSIQTPVAVVGGCNAVLKAIEMLGDTLKNIRLCLDNTQQEAVDVYFGEADIFSHIGEDTYSALAEYLFITLQRRNEEYSDVQTQSTEERRKTFLEIESRAIDRHQDLLHKHNFKQGFVSTEVLV